MCVCVSPAVVGPLWKKKDTVGQHPKTKLASCHSPEATVNWNLQEMLLDPALSESLDSLELRALSIPEPLTQLFGEM